jgi:hypothetical protein
MASIPVKPRIPVINWGNPIVKGLVFDISLKEGSGINTFESITKAIGAINASGATWEKNKYGNDLDFSAAASKVVFVTPSQVNSLVKYSYEFLFNLRGLGGGSNGRIIVKGASGGTPYTQIYTNTNYGGGGYGIAFEQSWTTIGKWAYAINLNTWYHVIITYNGDSTSNDPIYYINGLPVVVTEYVAPATSLGADTTELDLGNRTNNQRNFDGKLVYTRIWNRILSPQEVKSLYTNPWQIYTTSQSKNWYLGNIISAGTKGIMTTMKGWWGEQ